MNFFKNTFSASLIEPLKKGVIKKEIKKKEANISLSLYKKGDFIKIIYLENSILNCYKGYIGEIVDIIHNDTQVLVTLNALNSCSNICFPISHIISI